MTEKQMIRPKELAQQLSVSVQTLWRWRRENRLPPPITLGPRMIFWEVQVIEDWIEQKRDKPEKTH
jgi:prophage regulatory protein